MAREPDESFTGTCHMCGQPYLRDEIERLKAENAVQKAEMQKLYENWVRVLNLPEEPKP